MTTDVKAIWKKADAVCFDVDSTVIEEEAIDELAKFCGKGKEIQELTKATMGGKMEFRESLHARLNMIRPTMHQVQEFIRVKPPTLSANIKKLVNCLQRRGVPIYLVSGGFRGIIGPIALELNIPLENIFANKLKFFFNVETLPGYTSPENNVELSPDALPPVKYNGAVSQEYFRTPIPGASGVFMHQRRPIIPEDLPDSGSYGCQKGSESVSSEDSTLDGIQVTGDQQGEYAGFDDNEPTSKSGGKGEVMSFLIKKFGYSNMVMIGDGATDAEASPPAHAFIGYGGNVIREGVRSKAQWYIADFQELIDEIQ